MKLLTKELEKKLIQAHEAPEQEDSLILAKFFNPIGAGTWYVIDYNPTDRVFFALCEIQNRELGYVSLHDLESYKGPFGLGIERDLYFTPCKLSTIK